MTEPAASTASSFTRSFLFFIEHTRIQFDLDGQEIEVCVAAGFHAGLGEEEPECGEPITYLVEAAGQSDQSVGSGHSYVWDLVETDAPDDDGFSASDYLGGGADG